MSSLNGHHAAGGPSPGAQSSFHPGAYSNISSLSHTSPPSQHMGSGHSKPTPSPPPSSSSAALKGISAAVAGGFNIKRAFATKRKKSQDILVKSAEHDSQSSTQVLNITGKKPVSHLQQSSSPPPPPTPPKRDKHLLPSPLNTEQSRGIQLANRASVLPITPGISSAVSYMLQQQQTSPVVDTPVSFKSPRPQPQPQSSNGASMPEEAEKAHEKENDKIKLGATADNMPDKREAKETWRKSDSTNSHHTIRPGGGGGSSRTSWAESLQSTNTVVQVSNKRLSALITDADYATPEEDDDEYVVPVSDNLAGHPPKSTPPASLRLKNRRSMSLNLGAPSISKTLISPPLSASVTESKRSSRSISEGVPPFLNTQLTTSPSQSSAPAQRMTPVRSPVSSMFVGTVAGQQSYPSATSNIRGRLAAWTNNNSSSDSVSRQDRALPVLPHHQRQASNCQPTGDYHDGGGISPSSTSPRPIAISMTGSGIGPAAAGLAKRAVEMGRKWGMGLTSSTSGSGSGYSSSSSSIPSSYSSASHTDYGLVRTNSNQSTPSVHSHIVKSTHSHGSGIGFSAGGKRRTPDAPSGAYSIHSIPSKSDNDPFTSSSGPILGTLLRVGLRNKNGAPVTGGVFGKELSVVTRETGVNVGKGMGSAGVDGGNVKAGLVLELEGRLVPAVVVRCAQHLLIWGVQEEGLFRVNGRPSHVSKLRTEFDSGVDYDMTECSPGDLDPHAVASVFKAYLRELPESILTRALSPFFDAAIKKEASSNFPEQNRFSGIERNLANPGLPQGPKGGFAVRKPPSLTTLAMPTFTGIPPPSTSLVADIRSLISQLPQENYDLLRTVVDLIKATGMEYKKTKMPLSNLMLVFCPSLNMTPPLLKVLCEVEDIWAAGSAQDSPPPPLPMKDGQFTAVMREEADMTDASDEMQDDDEEDEVEEKSLMSSGRTSLDTADGPSSGYRASEEEEGSLSEEGPVVRRRWITEQNMERSEIPTVYLDTRSHYSSSSTSSLHELSESSGRHHHGHTNSTDDNGSILSASQLVHSDPPVLSPLCSSSAESVATPTSDANSSFSQLPVWDDAGGDEKKTHGVGPVEIVDPDSIPVLSPARTPKNASVSQSINEDAVQFPQLSITPSTRQAKRMSIPLLSLPNFSPASLMSFGDEDRPKDNDSPCPSPTSSSGVVNLLTRRSKRPSLRLLFSKKSGSSLNSLEKRSGSGIPFISNPVLQQPQGPPSSTWELGTSDSSISTPLSAVTAASGMSSHSLLLPVLDTPIEDSSLSLDLGFDISPPTTAMPLIRDDRMSEAQMLANGGVGVVSPPTATTSTSTDSMLVTAETTSLKEAPPPMDSRILDPLPPSPVRSSLTHVRSSSLSVPKRPPLSLETQSFSSSAPSPQLSLLDDDEEDWSQSVLSAADRLT